jgi:hypothetical protein
MKSKPKALYLVLIASRVVPEMSVTMFRSWPVNALISEDFPTFGLPIIANFIVSLLSSLLSIEIPSVIISSRSPVFLPTIAETSIGSPSPSL